MPKWYERYQQGLYQQVYDELVTMQEEAFEEPVAHEARVIAQEMMRRVRMNIELLIPRLKALNYQFVDGYWVSYWEKRESTPNSFYTSEQLVKLDKQYRIFRPPLADTPRLLQNLEQLVGSLPLSIRSWYEEVGSVNLIGTFPATKDRSELSNILDPLLIVPLDDRIEYFSTNLPDEDEDEDDEEIEFDLAVDANLKYNYSGSGGYFIKTPCRSFDALFELENESLMFVDYLRTCFQWGGMFGLARLKEGPTLTRSELEFLTKDLLPF